MKKKHLHLFLSISVLAVLMSCKKSELSPAQAQIEKEKTTLSIANNLWTPDEAVENTKKFISGIGENGGFRSDVNVSSVIPFSSSLERSGKRFRSGEKKLPDTTLYLINFENNSGYAIAAADKRVSPVIAYVPKGNLVGLDNIDNPGVRMYVKRAISYIEIESWSRDSIFRYNPDGSKIDLGHIEWHISNTYGKWEEYKLDHLLSTEWGQRSPFNDKAPITNGRHAPAGCVAIAVAQIFSYYENPLKYNWDVINKYANLKYNPTTKEKQEAAPLIAQLIREIGDGVHMEYRESGSGASSESALAYMRSQGFQCDDLTDYNIGKIKESILNGYPVYIEGFEYKDKVNKKDCIGHAWVIDGVGVRRRKVESFWDGQLIFRSFETDNIISCNWGWNGSDNGYFLADVLAADQNSNKDSNSTPRVTFTTGFRIIANINK